MSKTSPAGTVANAYNAFDQLTKSVVGSTSTHPIPALIMATIPYWKPIRNQIKIGANAPIFYWIFFLMVLMAPFSSRETCAWEIPTSAETSICVFPS